MKHPPTKATEMVHDMQWFSGLEFVLLKDRLMKPVAVCITAPPSMHFVVVVPSASISIVVMVSIVAYSIETII